MRFPLLLAVAGTAVATTAYVPGRVFDRFITIWLENQDFAKVDRNADMIALAKQGISLTEFYALTHPSQPNYIASVGGDYFGLNHDSMVEIPQNVSTLVDLLDTKNIDWRGYFEGVPGPGYMGPGSTPTGGRKYDYVRKHNPFVSYQSINRNGTRLAKLQSLAAFERDVKADTLPQFAHISPDMDNDGHDTSLEYAANWSMAYLTPLLSNAQFMKNTLILLTYDESETYPIPNHITSILLGGAVPQSLKGTKDSTIYTLYSILSTVQNNWELPNLGRYDVGANVFDFVAKQTGYINIAPSDPSYINNSRSYGGFLNSRPENYLPIPAPNLQLIGAGGQGVADAVHNGWHSAADLPTPYDGTGRSYDGGDGTTSPNAPVYRGQGPANITVVDSIKEKSAARRTLKLDITWSSVGFGAFALAAFLA